jgi:hypothetical protein
VQNDKLPAIEGLANLMEKEKFGRYLAGLWEGELTRELAWYQYPQDFKSRLQ